MKVRPKPILADAHQWHENGDHPLDDVMRPFEDTGSIPASPREGKIVRYFRHPNVPGDLECAVCNRTMHIHGWLDTPGGGQAVCPGDFIVMEEGGRVYALHPKDFNDRFEPVH